MRLLFLEKVRLILGSFLVVPAISKIAETESVPDNSYFLSLYSFPIPYPFKHFSCLWGSTICLSYYIHPSQLDVRKLCRDKQKHNYNNPFQGHLHFKIVSIEQNASQTKRNGSFMAECWKYKEVTDG